MFASFYIEWVRHGRKTTKSIPQGQCYGCIGDHTDIAIFIASDFSFAGKDHASVSGEAALHELSDYVGDQNGIEAGFTGCGSFMRLALKREARPGRLQLDIWSCARAHHRQNGLYRTFGAYAYSIYPSRPYKAVQRLKILGAPASSPAMLPGSMQQLPQKPTIVISNPAEPGTFRLRAALSGLNIIIGIGIGIGIAVEIGKQQSATIPDATATTPMAMLFALLSLSANSSCDRRTALIGFPVCLTDKSNKLPFRFGNKRSHLLKA